ncbi:hypothetical protein COCCADRAFT_80937 [Bipolaris zeicola 26-R-13]|uniref:Uncharacterized protein n=1 Tax=Cochliobolus carbonum (strain 26-R-13) TaxID=930089 RepID=W6YV35_COCC2|nr:uncharacterized protein COCCADRAFT_80937 [Bipolaris zeicola 26-R-13]EUC39359.1 hypothetical protein COCCADRAFT_80937 [Bipolaris zeicola 26-R-13]
MRRPSAACRRAVQSLQLPTAHHVWISDDLLARALLPFFPSSCPHQRRHGSNVPGPLEARRRAAKRRMTVSAGFHPQYTFQSLFNLGALFAFRKESQPTWRYEAPSLQHRTEPLDLSSTPRPNPLAFPNSDEPEYASARTSSGDFKQSSAHILARFDNFKSQVISAGDLSFAERNRLLANAWKSCCPVHSDAWMYNTMVVEYVVELGWDPSNILSEHESFALPPMYTLQSQSFLDCLEKSSARFSHAAKVYHEVSMRMVELAGSVTISTNTSQDTELLFIIRLALQGAFSTDNKIKSSVAQALALVADKIQNIGIREALLAILTGANSVQQSTITLLARVAADYKLCVTLEMTLFCLPRKQLRWLVPSVTTSLAMDIARETRLPNRAHEHRLSAWLTVLEGLDRRSASRASSADFFDTAIAAVNKYVFRNSNPGRMRGHVLLHALTFQLTQQTLYAFYRERTLQLIYAPIHTSQEPLEFETFLGLVFARMQKEGLPCTPLVDLTVYTFTRHAELMSVYCILSTLKQRGLMLENASSIQSRFIKRAASLPRKTESMNEQARQHYAFALRTCQGITNLLVKLVSSSSTSTASALAHTKKHLLHLQARREFTAILDRASANNALPQMYATTTSDIPTSDRTILIHQLAHFYSLSTTRSHRETWRSIYYMYNYLQTYSLPIGPLFTKAVVRAAIIRPMMEHRFISARRLIWVCHLVARVEGENVARQIESSYWRWRGELIRHAKRAHDDAGGDRKAKAMVGKMKGLGLI